LEGIGLGREVGMIGHSGIGSKRDEVFLIADDDPAVLVFPSVMEAQGYMEVCDVEDGLWRAFDWNGGEFVVSVKDGDVCLQRRPATDASSLTFRRVLLESLGALGQLSPAESSGFSLQELATIGVRCGYDPV
jgi:hypothetical protein